MKLFSASNSARHQSSLAYLVLLLTCICGRVTARSVAAQAPAGVSPSAGAAKLLAADPAQVRAAQDFFESRIRPLLVQHCYECHSLESGESSGDFRIDDSAATLRGGLSGPAIVAGDAGKSLLIKAVEYHDSSLQMPPEGKLDESQIQDL